MNNVSLLYFSLQSSSSSLSLNLGESASPGTDNGENRMYSARAPWRSEITKQDGFESVNEVSMTHGENDRPTTPADAVQKAVQKASDSKSGNVDMEALEQELVKIAPTIADLFNKIHQQTSTTVVATSEEELKKIKDDNDRLRKTNRSLVEKLNSFQQKIIQLQLENKKLREVSENEKIKENMLEQKSAELNILKEKLAEQKKALEEKERELDIQMEKIAQVVSDNEEQKLKLANLEQLHEEGMKEFDEQQQQIAELQQEKEQQKEQIQVLEEKQKMSESMLYRLEERLLQLERGGNRRNTRSKFGLSKPWMNGMVERSHHVNVKLQPQFPTDWSSNGKGGKGWSF